MERKKEYDIEKKKLSAGLSRQDMGYGPCIIPSKKELKKSF
jgi:hypothetical protein